MTPTRWLIFIGVCLAVFIWFVIRVTTIIAVLLSVFFGVDPEYAVAIGFFGWLGFVVYISVSAAIKKGRAWKGTGYLRNLRDIQTEKDRPEQGPLLLAAANARTAVEGSCL